MLRLQPQCIFLDTADHYRVQFNLEDGGVEEYTFSLSWTNGVAVLNCDQREFYYATYDDSQANSLLQAIDLFDEARRNASKIIIPIALTAASENSYRVRFEKEGSDVEYVFTVDDTGCAKGEDEFVKATFCDPFVPDLYRSILKFHTARGLEQIETQVDEKQQRHTA